MQHARNAIGTVEFGQRKAVKRDLVGGSQLQSVGYAREKLRRDRDVPAALKPAIPIFRHADELGDFLPPKSGHAAALEQRQTNLGWFQACAHVDEERSQF